MHDVKTDGTSESTTKPSLNGDTVLVVEDDVDLNELLGAYVEMAGYRCCSAADGATALREVEAHLPSLILLDLMLPDTDGFEICRKLKSNERTRSIPVLMLTAMPGDDCRRKGLECGAQGYMTKPFDPDHLMSAIKANATKSNH